MESLAPPLKKTRSDGFSNGSAAPLPPSFGGPGDATERESFATNIGSKSRACLKFFSTSGCPYGEGCHFSHYVPGGLASLGLNQASSITTSGSLGLRKDAYNQSTSTLGATNREQNSAPSGYKTRLCKNLESGEGCRFGPKCHFAHGEEELRKYNGTLDTTANAYDRFPSQLGMAGTLDEKFGLRTREPTPPGLAAAATFGAVSTAKVSIDASLAGIIIGKGGVNAKAISRATGAKLFIKEHESDPNLKNVEMEGSFDQIKQASAMVRDLLAQKDVFPSKPGAHAYKSKLCENFPKGTCTFGDRCHFAHGQNELQQAVP